MDFKRVKGTALTTSKGYIEYHKDAMGEYAWRLVGEEGEDYPQKDTSEEVTSLEDGPSQEKEFVPCQTEAGSSVVLGYVPNDAEDENTEAISKVILDLRMTPKQRSIFVVVVPMEIIKNK